MKTYKLECVKVAPNLDCPFVAKAESEDGVLVEMIEHAKIVHGSRADEIGADAIEEMEVRMREMMEAEEID